MHIDQIASVCHEANRAYCQSLGDESQPPWDLAPVWQQESAIKGVEAIKADPDREPKASHESWMRHRLGDGWTYHTEKDVEKKQHPCMLSFDKLPREQQAKDFIFLAIARSLLELG